MSTTPIVFKKLPGVLSFQRGLLLSDATFFNLLADGVTQTPVMVRRHGIRGTQNINKGLERAGDKDETTADTARQEVSNIQTTDSAKLDADAQALVVRFDVRFLDLAHCLFAVASGKGEPLELVQQYRGSVERFIERAKASPGIEEVARRFARNLANGRWLWRNRTLSRSIQVEVRAADGEAIRRFDALAISLNHFEDYSDAERTLGEWIADGLRGERLEGLHVEAVVDFGVSGALEVFPSQNYVEKKPKGFARPLYCLGHPSRTVGGQDDPLQFESIREMGHAALRDQKIGNALRTIDTWYPAYGEQGRPIPIEPNGASLEAQTFFRSRKTSAFEYARVLDTLDPASPEGMFMIASLIRGGVFSEKGEA